MAKAKEAEVVKEAAEVQSLDITKTLENLKKQVEDFTNQEEYSKAMKNKALGAIEALTAVQQEESK
jgi:glutaredoxin-related protein